MFLQVIIPLAEKTIYIFSALFSCSENSRNRRHSGAWKSGRTQEGREISNLPPSGFLPAPASVRHITVLRLLQSVVPRPALLHLPREFPAIMRRRKNELQIRFLFVNIRVITPGLLTPAKETCCRGANDPSLSLRRWNSKNSGYARRRFNCRFN